MREELLFAPDKRVRIAAASLRTTPLDFAGNRARIIALLQKAREAAVNFIVFPELSLSGYECGDFFWHPWVVEAAWESLQALLPYTEGLYAAVGLPLAVGNALYNAAALIGEGRLWGFELKRTLPHEGVFYEPRWFQPAPPEPFVEPRTGVLAGHGLAFHWGPFYLTMEICEDAWQPGRPLEKTFAHIAFSLNASPYEIGKAARRFRLIAESSYRYHCVYAYANLLGNEAGKLLYGGEAIIAYEGEILASAPSFSYGEGAWVGVALLEEDLLRSGQRSHAPLPAQVIPLKKSGSFREGAVSLPSSVASQPSSPWHELTEALAMGLWDYLWKSRSRGFVVSLSGGLDSAACAIVAHLALKWARERLSPDLYRERLSYLPEGFEPRVYAFYQATAQSSQETFLRAQRLAQEVGLSFHAWNLQPIVDAYEALVQAWSEEPLSWEKHDIARQNLQARARVPALWMAANLLGALLLTTSNRSELIVGYSTMDGDTAGGLAPIGGLAKTDLKAWALWAADHFGWAALREIALAAPTAELRPGPQTDEEDLFPYPVLNELEIALVRQGASPDQLRALLEARNLPLAWIEKFLRLFHTSQWKRERAAPAFHVDRHDVDPRSAARFPILHAPFS